MPTPRPFLPGRAPVLLLSSFPFRLLAVRPPILMATLFFNLTEYAFALEPYTANSSHEALGISLANSPSAGMLFTYVQRKDATDLYYQIEYTDDLTNNLWNLLTDPQELTTALDLGQVWQRTILVPPHFPNQKPAHEFLRLRLHQQTNLSQPIVLNYPPQQFTLKLHEPFLDIDLCWIDRSNQETGYRIERRPASTSSWIAVSTTDSRTHSFNAASSLNGHTERLY